jgi:hypothetical protein
MDLAREAWSGAVDKAQTNYKIYACACWAALGARRRLVSSAVAARGRGADRSCMAAAEGALGANCWSCRVAKYVPSLAADLIVHRHDGPHD